MISFSRIAFGLSAQVSPNIVSINKIGFDVIDVKARMILGVDPACWDLLTYVPWYLR